MTAKLITAALSFSKQIQAAEVAEIAAAGFKSIIGNRPDGEGADQPGFAEIETRPSAAGLQSAYQPIESGKVGDSDALAFAALVDSLPKPVFASCRTGSRSATLRSLAEGGRGRPLPAIIAATKAAGYDMAGVVRRIANGSRTPTEAVDATHEVVIIGGGAPQKALDLSADHWRRSGRLQNITIDFFNAGAVLFGVRDYVPALMAYIEKYRAQLHFQHHLSRIDDRAKTAWFSKTNADSTTETVETGFDMIHVKPPQIAPDFVRVSPLADAAGWVDVDQAKLRHKSLPNIYGLGNVTNTPNAKTAGAARKQAPIVAHHRQVHRGKSVLAEFGYGGKLLRSFPNWLIDGTKPSQLASMLKEQILPPVCWKAMLRGRKWMAKPQPVTAS